MAHQLSFTSDGQAEAFFALKPAWHGLGTVLDHAPTSEEAILQARLGWRVGVRPLQTAEGIKVPDFYATVREDSGAILGVVSDRYQVVQNQDAFGFLDSLMMDGAMTYESAGALRGGRTVWLLARLPSVDYIAPGDASRRYILFSTSHDGTAAIHAMPTTVRVVCANTLRLATTSDVGIRHTGDLKSKLDRARQFLSQLDAKFTGFNDKAQLLAQKQVQRPEAEEYVEKLFPTIQESGRARTIREKKVCKLRINFRNERQSIPSIRGTWWALYNSVSEFIDHQAGVRGHGVAKQENRMMSTLDGQGAAFKTKAFDLAFSIASAV